jgi:hypothetical protein
MCIYASPASAACDAFDIRPLIIPLPLPISTASRRCAAGLTQSMSASIIRAGDCRRGFGGGLKWSVGTPASSQLMRRRARPFRTNAPFVDCIEEGRLVLCGHTAS